MFSSNVDLRERYFGEQQYGGDSLYLLLPSCLDWQVVSTRWSFLRGLSTSILVACFVGSFVVVAERVETVLGCTSECGSHCFHGTCLTTVAGTSRKFLRGLRVPRRGIGTRCLSVCSTCSVPAPIRILATLACGPMPAHGLSSWHYCWLVGWPEIGQFTMAPFPPRRPHLAAAPTGHYSSLGTGGLWVSIAS